MIVAPSIAPLDQSYIKKPVIETRISTGQHALEAPKSPPVPEVLENIAWCESRNRHFNKNGKVLRGESNYYDVGKYQINIKYWGPKAKELGYDIFTEEGNEAMALFLFEKYSVKPWYHSSACWS